MTKKTISLLLALFTGLLLFGGHASAQSTPPVHLAIAYHKAGDNYNIVAQGTPGDRLGLYINDQNPTKATVNEQGWATFNHVQLVGSGKVSFTQVLQGESGSAYEQPLNFTEHYATENNAASFTPNNVRLHVAIAYYKGNNRYDIVVNNNPSEKLELYVNDKNPTKATVNNDNWATFRGVELTGSGKISFTHDYSRSDGSTFQWPIDYTEHYTATNTSAAFTPNKHAAKPVAKPKPKHLVSTPAPAPVKKVAPTLHCANGTYINSAGNTVCRPQVSSSVPAGATAKCRDGTYSFSQSHRGTCSHHGGVAAWL